MERFTAGPWWPGHLGGSGKCQCRTIVDEGHAGGVATVHVDNGISSIADGGNDAPPLEQAIANMHLIAAAPELYTALAAVVAVADRDTDVFKTAKAALAKARGETQERPGARASPRS